MKLSKYSLFVFLVCLFCTNGNAQEPVAKKGSISDQFDYIIKKSTNFSEKGQTYEVVKLDLLLSVKAQALDSIKIVQSKLEKARNGIAPLEQEIKILKANVTSTEKALSTLKAEKDDMFLLGIQMSKDSYKMVMWSIISVLVLLLLFFVYQFKNSNAITKSAQSALEDLENEFKEHRSAALAREQSAMRRLQDELNKQKKT